MSIAKSVCENYLFEDYALKLVQGSNLGIRQQEEIDGINFG